MTGGDLHVRQWNPAAPQGMNAPSSMRSSPRVADSVLITTWHDSPDEIDSGHLPALSHPKELANRILAYLAES